MAKKGKSESHWRKICNDLAKGKTNGGGRGWKPGKGKWLDTVDRILKCPETKRLARGGTNQMTLSFAPASTAAAPPCTCGWDHVQSESTASASGTSPATQPPQPKEKITIPFGTPLRPEPRRAIDDVRDKSMVYQLPGHYDLEVFGYTCGKCPHCKGTPKATGRLGGVKIVVTSSDLQLGYENESQFKCATT
jgi:hypothetical protein